MHIHCCTGMYFIEYRYFKIVLRMIFVGKSEAPYAPIEKDYRNRLGSFGNVVVVETKESKGTLRLDEEADGIRKSSRGNLYITSQSGKEISEKEIYKIFESSFTQDISIAVGGPFGTSDMLKGERISLLRLTFSHGLFRVMLLEQMYRQAMSLRGSAYGK